VFGLVILNGGLLLVDHIHFQYNGLLIGLLVLCLALAREKRHSIALALVFSTLVLMKHLFLTLAPLFAVYLIAAYCCGSDRGKEEGRRGGGGGRFAARFAWRLSLLAGVAVACLAAAFAPFYLSADSHEQGKEQLLSILSRLFPFGRGLVHAYWAPNVWALYYFGDVVLSSAARRLGFESAGSSVTRGLVGDFSPAILPAVPPVASMLLLLASMVPALIAVARRPDPIMLVRGTVYCSLSAFMLGFHVHEKAILVPWVVQTLLLIDGESPREEKIGKSCRSRPALLFLLLSAAGLHSLFPLLTALPELPVKVLAAAVYLSCAWWMLESRLNEEGGRTVLISSLSALCFVFLLAEIVHPALLGGTGTLAFLPLMVTSVVCALLLLICWREAWLQVAATASESASENAIAPNTKMENAILSNTKTDSPPARRTRGAGAAARVSLVKVFLFAACILQSTTSSVGVKKATKKPFAPASGFLGERYEASSAPLSDALLLQFSRNGHCFLPGLVMQEQVTEMAKVIKKEFAERKEDALSHYKSVVGSDRHHSQQPPFHQLFNTWKRNSKAKSFILHKSLGKIAAQLLDVDAVRLYQDSVFVKEPGAGPTEWHSDLKMAPFNSNDFVTFWLPLVPVPDHESGGTGLLFASKSHVDFALPLWFDPEEMDLSDRYLLADNGAYQLGDCSVHHGWCLHAAPPNESKETRWALSLSYIADGAPLLPTSQSASSASGAAGGPLFQTGQESGLRCAPDDEDAEAYRDWVLQAGSFLQDDEACPLVWREEEEE